MHACMHACMCKYIIVRTTYEYRVYTLTKKNFNRGRADAYGEKTQCTYGLSDWFKVGQNQLKPRQNESGFLWYFRAKIGYDASLAKGRAPGVC